MRNILAFEITRTVTKMRMLTEMKTGVFGIMVLSSMLAGYRSNPCSGPAFLWQDSSTTVPAGCSLVEQPAELLYSLPLTYPDSAKGAGLEGRAYLVLHIDTSGTVTGVYLKLSTGYAMLDTSALRNARAMRFKPAMDHGRTVASDKEIQFKFKKDPPTPK